MPRLLIFFLLLCFFCEKNLLAQCPVTGDSVSVVTTVPTGVGSLTNAINCANSASNITRIVFHIPGAGTKVIQPTSSLPALTKAGAWVDGFSQVSTVILDGALISVAGNGLTLAGNDITVQGLFIRNFSTPGSSGILMNSTSGTEITSNRISGNRVGITTSSLVQSFSINNNIFGLTLTGGAQGNTTNALNLAGGASAGTITSNTIANTGGVGINILGGTILISDNSIYCNLGGGITRSGAPPAAPIITDASTQEIRGTAAVGRVIEVFSHSTTGCTTAPCQGKTLLGTVTTPATGIWILNLAAGQITVGTQITATSTQNGNNTSVFATCASAADCSMLNANIAINNHVSCFGGNNGSATASASGASPAAPPTFLWNTTATTATISNLSAGTYTVTVTDAAGCTNSETATITQPAA